MSINGKTKDKFLENKILQIIHQCCEQGDGSVDIRTVKIKFHQKYGLVSNIDFISSSIIVSKIRELIKRGIIEEHKNNLSLNFKNLAILLLFQK